MAGGLFLVLSLAAAAMMHSRSAAAVHDAVRQAGYTALATLPVGSATVEGASSPAGRAQLQARVEAVWQEQLQWLAQRANSAALESCADRIRVDNLVVHSVSLTDGDGSRPRAVMLVFDYECSMPAPLLLDDLGFSLTIDGSWAELAPWA